MPKEGKKCERCASDQFVSTYAKNLPREVNLCEWDWSNLVWSRAEHAVLWHKDPTAFLDGFCSGSIDPIPQDPLYRLRLGMRSIVRMRNKRAGQERALKKSFGARQSMMKIALEFLPKQSEEKLEKQALGGTLDQSIDEMLHESSAGISALESRLKELVRQDPVYDRYLRYINDFDEPGRGGPGAVIYAVLLGEAGVARSLWCFDHVKDNVVVPQLRDRCSHSQQEAWEDRLLISSPSERRLGFASFPSSPHMAQFFGLGLQESGGTYQDGDALHEWNVRTFAAKGEKRCNDPVRKTFVCEHLPMSFNWMSAEAKKDHPWARLLLEEQVAKRAYWARIFDTTPPPRCTACMRNGCKKCENFSGNWELPETREGALWVCRCHDNGYYFASSEHLHRHAFSKLGRRFLDLLYHAALFIEGHVSKPPESELALKYLDGGKYLKR